MSDGGQQAVLAERLERVAGALESNGIWYCLVFGTLLGAVRDGAPIEWDHDIDLLARYEDRAAIWAADADMAGAGVRLRPFVSEGSGLALNPGRAPYFDPGYLSIELDGESMGEVYTPVLFADGGLRLYDPVREVAFWTQSSFPHWFVQELDTVTLGGRRYPIPRRADRLLEHWYGPDWRVPYRSERDGGQPREGHGPHSDLLAPRLATATAWCEAQGWDRSVYAERPAWPRAVAGAGPASSTDRTRLTSRSAWWHDLDELVGHY